MSRSSPIYNVNSTRITSENLNEFHSDEKSYRESVKPLPYIGVYFVDQCNRSLKPFNLHFNKNNDKNLNFLKKIPPFFQKGFKEYREKYMLKAKDREVRRKFVNINRGNQNNFSNAKFSEGNLDDGENSAATSSSIREDLSDATYLKRRK
ncbi:hypothetical protein HDU92_007268 [Lobulomyces angularis]|nr:hypothetical protein HDU92_007268 [Lobulomyces angularis]